MRKSEKEIDTRKVKLLSHKMLTLAYVAVKIQFQTPVELVQMKVMKLLTRVDYLKYRVH